VSAPAALNIAQLAQIGLEFTGMTSDQAAAFTQTVDWTSTLVIPLPKNAATYQQVTVDGVTGTLIQRPADDAPQYALLWVKNGIIYAISSLGTNSQQAVQMANSLP
jgi:Na+/H+ antiporter NhaB